MKFVLSTKFPELNLRDHRIAEVSFLSALDSSKSNSLAFIPDSYQKASASHIHMACTWQHH